MMMNYIKTLILVMWTRLLYDWFSIEKSREPIPEETPYCYCPKSGVYCKYFRCLPRGYHACVFLGEITGDPTFGDGVKLCNINRPKYFEDNE